MAQNPITVPLPANLPENWAYGQIVSPNGTEVGLTQQYGYNYLMQQVNAAQEAATEIGEAFAELPTLGEDGKIPASQLPDLNAADTKLSNLDTPQEALYNLGAGVKPNLLYNAYFVGGGSQQGGGQLPINQQGQTSYSSPGNIFDGWIITGSGLSISLELNGISLTWSTSGIIRESLNNLSYFSGKIITMSALVSQVNTGTTDNIILRCRVNGSWENGTTGIKITEDGLATFTFTLPESIQSLYFEIGADSGSCKVYAAKLEEGSEQTLAYQDEGGNWQLLTQPESDYATQLLKCQIYEQTTLTPAVNIQGIRQIYAGTDDMEAGTTELTTGLIYLMYE